MNTIDSSHTAAATIEGMRKFPRQPLAHTPTPLEPMERLSREFDGVSLFVKRDDCTGLALGGNKIRQLEYYFGQALAEQADTALITGAVQSNFVRSTAAAARRLGMECHIQLEERVPDIDALHRTSGNVLLDQLLGATMHSYSDGEDEAGADANLHRIADELRSKGATPYVIPLGSDHDPLGALGYIDAAAELLSQIEEQSLSIDYLFVGSGSGATHSGLLFGLKALGSSIQVIGVCPRRDAVSQATRIRGHINKLSKMLDFEMSLTDADIRVTDVSLAPGYGLLNDATVKAMEMTARTEGLILDPVYTGKVMAALFHLIREGDVSGNIVFLHTGGQPALFAYGNALQGSCWTVLKETTHQNSE